MILLQPTIVLIPGAFSTSASLDPLASALRKHGYETVSVSLPSVNPPNPWTATCSADAAYVQNEIIKPIITNDKDVVIFGHSYGGIIAGGAAYGLSKSYSRHAHKAGVLGILLHAGTILPENATLEQAAGGLPPNIKQNKPSPGLSVSLPDGAVAQATLAFTSPAPKGSWLDPHFANRLAYIRTLKDESFPPDSQSQVIEQSGATWQIEDTEEGHEAFLEHPESVVEFLTKCVNAWSH